MVLPRIERAEHHGRPVWIKRYADQGRHKRLFLLRAIARSVGASALVAPMPLSANAACTMERCRIEQLHGLGVVVPEILRAGPRELVLSDLGPTLISLCRAAPTVEGRLELIAKGFAALADLHRRGGYASQSFARNMTYSEGLVGFIDLEEDPCLLMSLAAAQARDTLFYVYSTARYFGRNIAPYRDLLAEHLVAEPEATRIELARTARGLAWLPKLLGVRESGIGLLDGLLRPAGGRSCFSKAACGSEK